MDVYQTLQQEPLSLASYAILLLATISPWLKFQLKNTILALAMAVVCGVLSARLNLLAIPIIFLFGACTYYAYAPETSTTKKFFLKLLLLGMILNLGMPFHNLPFFNNWKIVEDIAVSSQAIPMALYLNFDKPLVGLFPLILWLPIIQSRSEWKYTVGYSLKIALLASPILLGLAYGLNYVQFDFKIPAILPLWSIRNLVFTCIAEEVFFRGMVQGELTRLLEKYPRGEIIAWIAASMLFGLFHFSGGIKYIFLSFVAGLFYGHAYRISRKIESSILSHFFLNLIHFIFFTYPAINP